MRSKWLVRGFPVAFVSFQVALSHAQPGAPQAAPVAPGSAVPPAQVPPPAAPPPPAAAPAPAYPPPPPPGAAPPAAAAPTAAPPAYPPPGGQPVYPPAGGGQPAPVAPPPGPYGAAPAYPGPAYPPPPPGYGENGMATPPPPPAPEPPPDSPPKLSLSAAVLFAGGGEEIYHDEYVHDSPGAGTGVGLSLAARVTPFWTGPFGFGLGAEIGYKGVTLEGRTSDNTLDLYRFPLVLSAHGMVEVARRWYLVGRVGVQKDLGTRLTGKGDYDGTGVDLSSIWGGMGEFGAMYAGRGIIGASAALRFAHQRYEDDFGLSKNANSLGLVVSIDVNLL